jgi:sugar porter (SP) family MFS transporter
MFAGIPADRFGRRDSLRIMAVLYVVSAVGCAFAWDWYSLVFFRFVGGLGIGGSSVLGPMYIAEVSPARWRGRLVGFFQFNVVSGILLAYLSNYLLGTAGLGAAEWRWKLGVSAIPAVLFFAMLFGIPRSPRWLVQKRRDQEARAVLEAIGEEHVDAELRDIVASIDAEHGRGSEPLFSHKYRFPIFLAVSIAMFNQLSGINAILYYLNDIFAKAGFSKVSGDLQAVAIGATNLLFTILAMSIIDKVGRRFLLLVGSVGTAACLGGVAYIFSSAKHEGVLVWLLVGFIAFFAFSQGAVIWVYLGEVFPNRVRAKGQSLGSLTHWFMAALIAWTFPVLAKTSGGAPFIFFSAMMVVQFFVVLLAYPETKGVSLEAMQKKLGIV